MERFEVKILENRKRITIKAMSAPDIEQAEHCLLLLLFDIFKVPVHTPPKYYVYRDETERKLVVKIKDRKLSILLKKVRGI